MKLKFMVITLFIFTATLTVYAQDNVRVNGQSKYQAAAKQQHFEFTLELGPNVNFLNYFNPLPEYDRSFFQVHTGQMVSGSVLGGVRLRVNNWFVFQTGVRYSQIGGNDTRTIIIPNAGVRDTWESKLTVLRYLSVPVRVAFSYKLPFQIISGVEAGYLLEGFYVLEDFGPYNTRNYPVGEEANRWNVQWLGGFGKNITIGSQQYYLQVIYHHGIMNVKNSGLYDYKTREISFLWGILL